MKELYIVGEPLPNFMNAKEIANYLGVSKAVIYGLIHTEGFPLLKVGRVVQDPQSQRVEECSSKSSTWQWQMIY